jgi:AAA domain
MKYQSQEEIAQTWERIHRGRTHHDPTDERAAFREMLDSHEGKQKKNGGTGQKPDESRRLQITWADTITPEPVRWGWIHHDQGRMALGSLAVAAGREGCGKSQFGIWLAAQITNGTLPGLLFGKPRRVLIVATEDSWKHTIVPRLMAAGANRSMVGRVDAISEGDEALTISLPKETSLLEVEINKHDVALVILDPMLSAITADLDSYRVRDMRSAIEPLVAVADRTGCLMLGIAHFNNGNGTDVATLLSGSHAFRDIPRAIFGFAKTKTERVLSQVKNSLGRDDLPSFAYTIEEATVHTQKGDAVVSKFVLGDVSHRDVADLLADGDDEESDIGNAAQEFLLNYLMTNNLVAPASKCIAAGTANGYTADQMKKARARMQHPKVLSKKADFGAGWEWCIEGPNDA